MRYLRLLAYFGALLVSSIASAEVGASLRGGTLGLGVELNVGLTETLNVRLGYSTYNYDDTIEETEVTYDGEIKLRNPSALLDWHAFGGGFRFSFGAVATDTEIEATGRPTAGTYELDGQVFTASQVGSLRGTVEMGNSVSPYVGVGWGNTVDAAGRVTFLFDIGAVYMGTPEVDLIATCGTGLSTANCNRLQAAVQQEEDDLAEDATLYEWYPVISLGIAVRF
jgi:outer membrane protein assembly factor BamA